MKLLSKAEEIKKMLDLMNRGVITKKEYQTRLANTLQASYQPYDGGVESNDENTEMKRLVDAGVLKKREYQVQWKQIEKTVAFGYQGPVQNASNQPPQSIPKPKKPFYKKVKFYLLCFFGLVILMPIIKFAINSPEAQRNVTTPTTVSEQQAGEETPKVPNYVGQNAVEAADALEAEGYAIKATHATSGLDFTEEFKIDETDWIVIDQTPPSDGVITLTINTQSNIDDVKAQDALLESLTEKLTPSIAWGTFDLYGEQEYPYGFDLHIVTGMLAETPKDENTWFLKATCTIENAFGNQYDTEAECEVTGTNDNPKVTRFYVYE